MKIRKNDMVVVIAGNDSGKTGKVLKIFPKNNRVIIEVKPAITGDWGLSARLDAIGVRMPNHRPQMAPIFGGHNKN